MLKQVPKIFTICSVLFFLFSTYICLAQSSIIQPGNYSSDCIASGNCQLNDFIKIFIVASKIILGITGSLALLAFIYGGVIFLISAGSSERVTQAKQIILGAVIGLVIVFTSFMIIQFVFTALKIPGAEKGQWAIGGWFK